MLILTARWDNLVGETTNSATLAMRPSAHKQRDERLGQNWAKQVRELPKLGEDKLISY